MKKMKLWQLIFLYLFVACNAPDQPTSETGNDLGIKDAAETRASNLAMITEARQIIGDGDLILRTGNDYSSEQVKLFSKSDQTYSHGGIAVRDSGDIYVYHVVPDYLHIKDKVRKEKLDSFLNPVQNLGFGIARYQLDSPEVKTFIKYLDKQYQDKIPFDVLFELGTDDSMYCSEMIKKGLVLSTGGRITIENDRLLDRSKYKMISMYFKVPEKKFAGKEYIPIDHLFIRPDCQVLKRYVYQ